VKVQADQRIPPVVEAIIAEQAARERKQQPRRDKGHSRYDGAVGKVAAVR
jgi:hypothetical protein